MAEGTIGGDFYYHIIMGTFSEKCFYVWRWWSDHIISIRRTEHKRVAGKRKHQRSNGVIKDILGRHKDRDGVHPFLSASGFSAALPCSHSWLRFMYVSHPSPTARVRKLKKHSLTNSQVFKPKSCNRLGNVMRRA